jgi:hypothetical protein
MYVIATIYFLSLSPSLESWLKNSAISTYLTSLNADNCDNDAIFSKRTDEDYDRQLNGVSMTSFQRYKKKERDKERNK